MSVSQVAAYYPAAVGTMPRSRSPTPSRPFSYPEYGHTPHIPAGHAHDIQDVHDSQDSVVSAVSSTFSAPWLPSSSSTLSTSTVPDADSTPAPPAHEAPDHAKLPRLDAAADAPRTGDTTAGPNPLASPVAQGSKRKADEPLKAPTAAMDTPVTRVFAHKRNKSMDVHGGSRIGEVRNPSHALMCLFADG